MNPPNPCPRSRSDEVTSYVAGTLAPAASEDFELHMVECEDCQRAIREGAVLSAALRPRGRRRVTAPLAGALLAAAVAAGVLLTRGDGGTLAGLGGLGAPPVFQGLAVRVDDGPDAEAVAQGMAAYQQGDFTSAAALLARGGESPDPGVQYFLGVARLYAGDDEGAARALAWVLATAGNAYEAEARLYLAKARIRLGDGASALEALAPVTAAAGPVEAHGAAFADSIRAAMR